MGAFSRGGVEACVVTLVCLLAFGCDVLGGNGGGSGSGDDDDDDITMLGDLGGGPASGSSLRVGEDCRRNSDCRSGTCIKVGANEQYCSDECSGSCPNGFRCQAAGSSAFCVRDGSGEQGDGENRGGCSVDPPVQEDPFVIDSCARQDICICASGNSCPNGGGDCEPAFSRRYDLLIFAAVVPERKSNGDCWDLGCGAPDPYVAAYLDDEFVGRTPTRQDSFQGEWGPNTGGDLGRITVINGSQLLLRIVDEDLSDSDGVLRCDVDLDAETLRRRVIICINDAETAAIVAGLRP